jgi:murein DD-endopeptidase MepM/ murein hydrolase activator NlpD
MKNLLSDSLSLVKKILSPSTYMYLVREFGNFLKFFNIYIKDKVLFLSGHFEGQKGNLVRNVLIRRGKRNRIFLHISAMVVLTVGIIVSPLISDSNLFGKNPNLTFAQGSGEASITTTDVFNTQESEKPRAEIIKYTVQPGDTISTVGKKFGISTNTIKWQNNLTSDNITVGDTLEILPVTGVAHKVAHGDTIYTIAKKYKSNPQSIVDFPFNDFANPQTFSLVEGQILIVPEGVPPAVAPTYVRQQFIATGPVSVTAGGFTWPLHGTINQSYSWYHRALDIGAGVGTPVAAATNGRVSEVYTSGYNGGYGTHVIITGDNGYSTLYAHMQGVNVSAGQTVAAGKTIIGWVGLTGRTTGAHLHFEVRSGGGFLDPSSVLR